MMWICTEKVRSSVPMRKAQSVLWFAILCRLAATASYLWHEHCTVHAQVYKLFGGNPSTIAPKHTQAPPILAAFVTFSTHKSVLNFHL